MQQFYRELDVFGPLTFASRIKRLHDIFLTQTVDLYRSLGINKKPVWFWALYLLLDGSSDQKTLAEKSRQSTSAVSQIIKELLKEGLVTTVVDEDDSRFKKVSLSKKGRQLMKDAIPVIKHLEETIGSLLGDNQQIIIDQLEKMEKQLKSSSLIERYKSPIKIIRYDDKYEEEFPGKYSDSMYEVYGGWARAFYDIELFSKEDDIMMRNPLREIVNKNGAVFFALDGEKVIGTIALIKLSDKTAEVSKIFVNENYRGQKIADTMMDLVEEEAISKGYKELVLVTNPRLKSAQRLYQRCGYIEVPGSPALQKKYAGFASMRFKKKLN